MMPARSRASRAPAIFPASPAARVRSAGAGDDRRGFRSSLLVLPRAPCRVTNVYDPNIAVLNEIVHTVRIPEDKLASHVCIPDIPDADAGTSVDQLDRIENGMPYTPRRFRIVI